MGNKHLSKVLPMDSQHVPLYQTLSLINVNLIRINQRQVKELRHFADSAFKKRRLQDLVGSGLQEKCVRSLQFSMRHTFLQRCLISVKHFK